MAKHSIYTAISTRLFLELESEATHSSRAKVIEEALRFYFKFRPPLPSHNSEEMNSKVSTKITIKIN